MYIRTDDIEHICTDDSERFDIKYGALTENPLRGSTARFIANPIIDDIEASPPKGRARRQRVNGRIVIDTTVPDGDDYRYESPSCIVTGDSSVNDLTTDRWENRELLDAESERQLIQRIQNGAKVNELRPGPWKPNPGWDDQRAFHQLLEAFHFRNVIKPTRNYIPARLYYSSKKQKPTTVQLYEDLTSVGCLALWQSALRFDGRGRFSTLARRRVIGEVSNEANYLRQNGFTGGNTDGQYLRKGVGRHTQTRLDRWIFSNLGAPPDELLKFQQKNLKRPVFHSLQEAADALRRANNLQHPDIYSDSGDDDVERDGYDTSKANRATEPLEEFRDVYQSQNPLYWSPQLAFHGNPLKGTGKVCRIVDFWIRELCDPPRIKAKPQPKPIYPPCKVKPTGRVLKPIDPPYWMKPGERQREWAGMYDHLDYNADRREVTTVQLKNGKTKQRYRQTAAKPNTKADNEWWSENLAHPYRESYVKYEQENEAKKWSYRDVRAEPNQANGRASTNVIVFGNRASRKPRLHVSERHLPEGAGIGFACQGIASGR